MFSCDRPQFRLAHRSTSRALWAAAAAGLLTAGTAAGDTKTYVGPATGAGAVWSNPSNWLPSGVPGPGDTAIIEHADSTSRTITLDLTRSISGIQVGNSGLGTNTIVQSGPFNLSTISEDLAGGGNDKAVHMQSAGSNTYSSELRIGAGLGSNGTYNLSSSGSVTISPGLFNRMLIGNNGGTGTFNQNGGSVTFGVPGGGFGSLAQLELADDPASVGHYNLNNAGTLTVHGSELIGELGGAVMNQSAGVNQNAAYVQIGLYAGSNGTYNLSGSGMLSADTMDVGGGSSAGGNGVFNMTGGSATLSTLKIYDTAATAVTLAGGALSVGSIDTSGNASRFNWTGGTLGITGTGGLAITAGGWLGATLNLSAAKVLNVTHALTISADGAVNVQSGVLTAGTVALSGALSGAGTVNSLISANSGSSISPGNGGAGTVALGGLTLSAGSNLVFDAGDRIDVTAPNAFNIAGATNVTVTNVARGSVPVISYAGSLAGNPSNLQLTGNIPFGFEVSIAHDAVNKTINLVSKESVAVDPVAVYGQPAPGGGTFPLSTGPVFLNTAGQMDFSASVNGSSSIYRKQNGTLSRLISAGMSAPTNTGTDGTLSDAFLSTQNASGQLLFSANVAGSGNGSTSGVFRRDADGTIKSIARLKDVSSIPGQFDNGFDSVGAWGMNSGGQVPFTATAGGTSALYRGDGTAANRTLIAYAGKAAPGGGNYSGNMGSRGVGINDAGQVAFGNPLTGTPNNGGGIFRWTAPSTYTLIAKDGGTAPGGATYTSVSLVPQRGINASGQIAFQAQFANAGGIFRSDGTTTVPIMRTLDPAPGGGTFASGSNAYELLDDGSVVFDAGVLNSGVGLFRSDGVSGVRIAQRGGAVPGGGTIETFDKVAGLETGQVIFQAGLNGTQSTQGIFIGDGTEVVQLVRNWQQSINGVEILDIAWPGSISMNNFGQVGVNVSFLNQDGNGSYVFTPALHWRSSSSGSWDTNTNWTVGLAPAFVHDVAIDPSSALTITGPATSRVVNSLVVGSGGAPVTLQLTAGTTLRTLDTISVDAAGGSKLDLRDGKLIAGASGSAGTWNGSRYTGIAGLVQSGRNGGQWNGVGMITTSAMPGNNLHNLGVATAEELGKVGQSFGGFILNSGDVLVMYTYGGDANLDGKINIDDYGLIDSHVGQSGTVFGWHNGDFNYDGKINIDDYGIIDGNIGAQGSPIPTGAIALSGVSTVPEPTTFSLIGMMGAGWLRRTRRR